MEKRKPDRRIQRTRQTLRRALVDLILKKGYRKITVQNIIDRANVGRSTFYLHFQDKDDLLASGFGAFAHDLSQQVEGADHAENPAHLLHSLDFFLHADQNRDLYRAMRESGGGDLILEVGRQHVQRQIEAHIGKITGDENLATSLPVIANFLAGALLSLLTWWVESGAPFTPGQMDEMFNDLAMPGVWKMLGKEVTD